MLKINKRYNQLMMKRAKIATEILELMHLSKTTKHDHIFMERKTHANGYGKWWIKNYKQCILCGFKTESKYEDGIQ